MEWTVKYHKNALKFLKRLDKGKRESILRRLSELRMNLEKGVLPIRQLDVKRLRGKWRGFLRLRIGEIRVIFKIDLEKKEILVYNVHFRGKVY